MSGDGFEEQQRIPMQLVWVDREEPIKTASIFVSQLYAENEIILRVGQVQPPMFDPDQLQPGALPFAQARELGRFGLTVSRAEKLIQVLEKTIRKHTDLVQRGEL